MSTPDFPGRKSPVLRDWLRTLFNEGFSGSQIAALSRGEMTRNAVIGMIYRLGLSADPSRPKRPVTKRPPVFKSAVPKVQQVQAQKRFCAAEAKAAALLQPLPVIEHDAARPCQWPFGEDGAVCGRACDPADWRSVYCRSHRALATRPGPGGRIVLRQRPVPELDRAELAQPFRFGNAQ